MSGSGELRVDYDALDDLSRVLVALKDEFDGLKDSIDPYRDAMGHDGVSDRLKRFATNWSDDRKKIVANMEEVAAFAEAAAEIYRETDEDVGAEFCG